MIIALALCCFLLLTGVAWLWQAHDALNKRVRALEDCWDQGLTYLVSAKGQEVLTYLVSPEGQAALAVLRHAQARCTPETPPHGP